MTISTESTRVEYDGDGGTKPFAVPFKFLDKVDLVVLLRDKAAGTDVVQTLTTHYTVTGAGAASGTVTFVTAPPTGQRVVIYNDPDLTQLVDYQSGDTFPAETHEQALDRLTLQQKRTRELVERAPRLLEGDLNDGTGTFDANLNRIKNLGVPTANADAATKNYVDSTVTNTVGPIPSGGTYVTATGSPTARTISDRWAEVFNVKDYGAVGDGVADDTAEIQAAIDAAGAYGHVYIPSGTYMLSDSLKVFKNIRMTGEGIDSKLQMLPGSTMTTPGMIQLPNTISTDGWATSTAYSLQDFVFNPVTFENYVCITAGTSGATAPTGTSDVSDGVCQWRYLFTAASATSATNVANRSRIGHFFLHGNSVAKYGILGVTNHTSFIDLVIQGTTVAGIRTGFGWCNYLERVEVSYTSGDGIQLMDSNNNETELNSCKVFANDGIGIRVNGYSALKLVNCLMEFNKKTGFYSAIGGRGLHIDTCYFESNSEDGITFAQPLPYTGGTSDVNIKADIILNGSASDTQTARAYLNHGVTVSNCYTLARYDNAPTNGFSFVMAPSVDGLVLTGNAVGDSSVVDAALLGTPGHPETNAAGVNDGLGSPTGMTANGNTGFASTLEVSAVGNLGLNHIAAYDHRFDTALNRNIAVTDMGKWGVISASNGGTFTRSAEVFTPAPRLPVYELAWATANGSHLFGYTVDAADFPDLHNKQMIIGCWVKHPFSGNGNIAPYFILGASANIALTSSHSSDTSWRKWFFRFKMPTTGTVGWSVRKIGAAGTVHAAAPILCEYGADTELLLSQEPQFTGVTWGSAAPVAGTYAVGNIVYNTAPTAGGTIGWVCTVAGTPGTWKTFGTVNPQTVFTGSATWNPGTVGSWVAKSVSVSCPGATVGMFVKCSLSSLDDGPNMFTVSISGFVESGGGSVRVSLANMKSASVAIPSGTVKVSASAT